MWCETVNIKISHFIYWLVSQCWGLRQHVWTHPALSPRACAGSCHCSKTKLLPSHWVTVLSCAPNIQKEQQEAAVASCGDLPHPVCASLHLKHIIKVCVAPWAGPGRAGPGRAGPGSAPSGDLELRGDLGATTGHRNTAAILLCCCPALIPSLVLGDCGKRCQSSSRDCLKVFCWSFSNCDLTQQTNNWATAHLFYKCLVWYWAAESHMKSQRGRTDRHITHLTGCPPTTSPLDHNLVTLHDLICVNPLFEH